MTLTTDTGPADPGTVSQLNDLGVYMLSGRINDPAQGLHVDASLAGTHRPGLARG